MGSKEVGMDGEEQQDLGDEAGKADRPRSGAHEELKRKREQEEKLEQIKREEISRLEKHSEPLRQYLMSFVVPTITSGLVEVCRELPEDPVGYLAEHLSVSSQLTR